MGSSRERLPKPLRIQPNLPVFSEWRIASEISENGLVERRNAPLVDGALWLDKLGVTGSVRRETGMEKEMRELYVEGVAIHDGPELCAGVREGVGEALTGVRVGSAMEPRN